jgi:hypothetical protein
MTELDQIRRATLLAWKMKGEDPPPGFDDLFDGDYSDEEVAGLVLLAEEWRLAAAVVEKVVGGVWVGRWEARGGRGLMLDEVLVTTKYGTTTESCVDEPGFWAWYRSADMDPETLFNPNSVRKGALPKAARETFFVKHRNVKPDAVRQVAAIPKQFLSQ